MNVYNNRQGSSLMRFRQPAALLIATLAINEEQESANGEARRGFLFLRPSPVRTKFYSDQI